MKFAGCVCSGCFLFEEYPKFANLCHEHLKSAIVFTYIHMLDTFRRMRSCKIDGANNGNNNSRPLPLSSPFGKRTLQEQTRGFLSSDSCIIYRMGPFHFIMTGEVAAAASIVSFISPN